MPNFAFENLEGRVAFVGQYSNLTAAQSAAAGGVWHLDGIFEVSPETAWALISEGAETDFETYARDYRQFLEKKPSAEREAVIAELARIN